MLKRIAVVLVAGAFLVATSARGDEVRAAIDAANAKMVADFAAGDANALARAYTEDALMLPPDATRIVGQSAIEALWKSWIDAGIKNLTLKATDVDSSGDLAYEVGEFTLEASFGRNPSTNGSNTTADRTSGNYLVVWKRGADGVWRLKVHTWN
jgi:ketosteroid isomerase-like protein